ncbi:hypothetical protein Tco_1096629 [Tanacetum coccineum]
MMTARKRVGPLPTHRLAVRHSVDYFSSDHFTSDDSSRVSPLSSSSETSSNSSTDALSDSSSSYSSLGHLSPALPSGIVGKNKSIGQCTAKQKVKVLLSRKSRYCQSKIEVLPWIKES